MGFMPMRKNGRDTATVLVAFVVALVLTACGGGDAEGTPSAAGDAVGDDGSADTTTTVVEIEIDEDVVEVGIGARPDWLPVWVFLPQELQISTSVSAAETGDGFVTGLVAGGDPRLLYDQALFMAQSGGYVFGEDVQTAGAGFVAHHTSNGSSVTFTAAGEPGAVIWTMHFSGLSGPAADTAVAAGPLDRRGNLSLTVPGVSSRIEGSCDTDPSTNAAFVSDDGTTTFEIAHGEIPKGEITIDVNGSNQTWAPSIDSEQVAVEITDDWVYYESDFLGESGVVFGVLQINCE